MIDRIVRDTVSRVISEKLMSMGDRFPNAVSTVSSCAEQLEGLCRDLVGSGLSRHEITVERIANAASGLRKIEHALQAKPSISEEL